MRLSTLGSVAVAMATLVWMVTATYRPGGLYADPPAVIAATHAPAAASAQHP